uniref:Uncharacterized protein n=1 Tax=Pseudo-nitzschia delicatissima TaxID=44447 RepID=A0A7S0XL92_9STRA|mmetsp:Transcript_2225/g.5256  ORF Transcript_2225/g.5256 Transcript_2225/m.5256 type:complete len:1064 (+) Transcript_2225:286-3477(+)|eukprot:CAMPEP_0116083718 /NCGR_PEP_ID=MMETSP0327-20121206/3425_1 /TAXON_ID=44447 /ORGANISM="Pseudo-nitzschia delicatissima, Strain B596" /LENGTH=1063 /DNA_ID=CAMNT_0003574629 /DNA_START=167 /DNA_END=3358 /DNA_ORIENTATION=+
MENGTTTQTSYVSSPVADRSQTRVAVRAAMGYSNENYGDENYFDNLNGNGYHSDTEEDTKIPGPLSFLESVVVSIYNCVGIGLHAGLAIAFLAIMTVAILGNFHDKYFVTILDRARRTDKDLQNEITYYQRRCDITDVTTSDSHHIHFGEANDTASEIFIDVDKIWEEEIDSYSAVQSEYYYDERGFRTKYQKEYRNRKRRRLGPKFNIWESPDLRPIPKNVAEKSGQMAVDTMMKHGSVMVPKILSDATIFELREFIDRKNRAVSGTSDEYPITASHNRISYGIESTEHPSVVRALKEIHDHGVMSHLIQNLVGDENPALSEITAITAWAGAEDQSWHADVKPDGNGVKFGRTYSHSYSLFLPLQATTKGMGATELCPGTHMCASDNMWQVCDSVGISASEVRKARPRSDYSPDEDGEKKYREDKLMEGSWRAGDGVLLNQQGWHRGPGHTEEEMEDRIMFIVSFLKRPHPDDPRQLARGTYFHQKWLNWGSTWEDMVDTMANLQRPWNILRCLHLYKPSDRSWGYDLFTATTLRVANNQMGGEPEDLDGIIDNVMTPLNFPEWLEGDLDYENEHAWTIYLSGTIRKTLMFLYDINYYGHIGLAGFVVAASILGFVYNFLLARTSSKRYGRRSTVFPVIKSGVKRLILTHGPIFALGFYVWRVRIQKSQWAIDIDSGKYLMRPFPTHPIFRDEDPGVLGVNSTLPRRSDVLIGTRMNTKAIGAYYSWFEYHPANRIFDQFVEAYGGIGGFYHSLLPNNANSQRFSKLPSGLSEKLVDSAFEMITKHHGGGRFLMQDYRSGDWLVLNEAESIEYIKKRLLIGNKNGNTMGAIQEQIDLLLDKQRFGTPRNALSMSWNSQLFLHDLSKKVVSTPFEREMSKIRKPKSVIKSVVTISNSIFLPQSDYRLPKWKPIGPTVSNTEDDDGNRGFLIGKGKAAYRAGMEIWMGLKNNDGDTNVYRGTIIKINHDKRFKDRQCRFQIALDEDGVAHLDRVHLEQVSRKVLKPRGPITSGGRITAELEDGEFFDGTIQLVVADGSIDVLFDDGDMIQGIEHDEFVTLDALV